MGKTDGLGEYRTSATLPDGVFDDRFELAASR